MSAALAAGGAGKRKSRFSGAELEVLVSEVTRCEGELFGPAGRLRRRERERIWAGILERVNAVSRVPRTLREVKKRWDDLKRRNGGRLADARHRSCYLPSSRGASMLGRSSQSSPRLQQARQKQNTRPKPSFPCFPDSDTGKKNTSNKLSINALLIVALISTVMSTYIVFFFYRCRSGWIRERWFRQRRGQS